MVKVKDIKGLVNRIMALDRLYLKADALTREFIRTGDVELIPRYARAWRNYHRRQKMKD